MEQRELTCITCPIGCRLSVEIDDEIIKNVRGNKCARGITYAESECLNPKRVLTAAIKLSDGRMLSVKTKSPIPKGKIHTAVKKIYESKVRPPINIGDVIVEDIIGTGVDVVATKRLR